MQGIYNWQAPQIVCKLRRVQALDAMPVSASASNSTQRGMCSWYTSGKEGHLAHVGLSQQRTFSMTVAPAAWRHATTANSMHAVLFAIVINIQMRLEECISCLEVLKATSASVLQQVRYLAPRRTRT